MRKNVVGIYKISNSKNECYIGSSKDIAKRWSSHLANLKNNKHRYEELQEAFNQNVNNIKWEIIDTCEVEQLEELEKEYIKYFKSLGYTVVNVWQKDSNIVRKSDVQDVSNMRKAQTGEKNGNSKLKEADVILIKILLKRNVKVSEIAKYFKVSYTLINNIKNGKRWASVDLNDVKIKIISENDAEIGSLKLDRLAKVVKEIEENRNRNKK